MELAGLSLLPGPFYKFEAVDLTTGRVYRGLYETKHAKNDGQHNAAKANAMDAELQLHLPPHGSSVVTVDLPFALPASPYTVHFIYEYFESSFAVPTGWYTGIAVAPPTELSVGGGSR